jgi:prepilin signal peptidase PulO-like enzyme (type II secretory pathway)
MTLAHHLILAGLSLLVGLCVGSFLNVCIHRLPLGLSLLRPRSRCPHCSNAIRARDNVPVVSWCFLRGKCRDCQEAISPRYVLIELITGLLFAGSYLALTAFPEGALEDRLGPLGVLQLTLVFWVLLSLIVVMAIIVVDGHVVSGSVTRGHGIGRQDEPLTRSDLAGVAEPVSVQLGKFTGAARVSQAISCDAAERLVSADDVDRLGPRFSQAAGPCA